MEEVDTRDRIARHCVQEALAVQDMLTPGATRRSRTSRVVEWLRMALLPNDGSPATELPATQSPATVLFNPSAAGPPFSQWHEPEPQPVATRKAGPKGRTSSPSHA